MDAHGQWKQSASSTPFQWRMQRLPSLLENTDSLQVSKNPLGALAQRLLITKKGVENSKKERERGVLGC